jgi:hypothetical protein
MVRVTAGCVSDRVIAARPDALLAGHLDESLQMPDLDAS